MCRVSRNLEASIFWTPLGDTLPLDVVLTTHSHHERVELYFYLPSGPLVACYRENLYLYIDCTFWTVGVPLCSRFKQLGVCPQLIDKCAKCGICCCNIVFSPVHGTANPLSCRFLCEHLRRRRQYGTRETLDVFLCACWVGFFLTLILMDLKRTDVPL
jgi:hypothetical protein